MNNTYEEKSIESKNPLLMDTQTPSIYQPKSLLEKFAQVWTWLCTYCFTKPTVKSFTCHIFLLTYSC